MQIPYPPSPSRRSWLLSAGAATLLGVRTSFCLGQAPSPGNGSRELLVTNAAQKAIDGGLKFLVSRQNEDGSFGTSEYAQNVAVCGLCGMAFLAQGSTPERGIYAATVARSLDFILQHAAENGLIQTREFSREPMYGHGFATLFLAESYGAARRPGLRDKLSRAVQVIVNSQNSEGGWRYEPRRHEADVSVTVCQMLALRAARNAGLFVPSEVIDRGVGYLKKAQNPDGGFTYMVTHPGDSAFPRSAAAVVALMSAGLYDSEEVRRGIEYFQTNAPPLKSLVGHSYLLYGHYYAVQAMWLVGGTAWRQWYSAVRDFLIKNQERNHAWFEAISPEYSTAMACLILQMPNNYLPIFQR